MDISQEDHFPHCQLKIKRHVGFKRNLPAFTAYTALCIYIYISIYIFIIWVKKSYTGYMDGSKKNSQPLSNCAKHALSLSFSFGLSHSIATECVIFRVTPQSFYDVLWVEWWQLRLTVKDMDFSLFGEQNASGRCIAPQWLLCKPVTFTRLYSGRLKDHGPEMLWTGLSQACHCQGEGPYQPYAVLAHCRDSRRRALDGYCTTSKAISNRRCICSLVLRRW